MYYKLDANKNAFKDIPMSLYDEYTKSYERIDEHTTLTVLPYICLINIVSFLSYIDTDKNLPFAYNCLVKSRLTYNIETH